MILDIKRYSYYLVNCIVFSFAALAFFHDRGYSLAPIILVILSLVWLVRRPTINLDRQDYVIMGIFCFYFLVQLVLVLYHGDPLRELDGPSRFIFVIVILIYLLNNPYKVDFLWAGVAIAGILVALMSIYLKFSTGLPRVHTDYISPLQLGNFSIVVAVISAAGIIWALDKKNKFWWVLLLCLGVAGGFLSSFLTGTRGGWIGLPFVALLLLKVYWRYIGWRWAVGFFLLMLAFVVFVYSSPQTGVKNRVDLAFSQVDQYFNEGQVRTSVGYRLEMWKSGLWAFSERPVLGWGAEGYKNNFEAQKISSGDIDAGIWRFNSLHSQYVEELATGGLLGLFGFLVLMGGLFVIFFQKINSNDNEVRSLGAAGALLVLCYLDFSLTLTFFLRNSSTLFFLMFVVFIYSSSRNTNVQLRR